jgi:hypothetical protein
MLTLELLGGIGLFFLGGEGLRHLCSPTSILAWPP